MLYLDSVRILEKKNWSKYFYLRYYVKKLRFLTLDMAEIFLKSKIFIGMNLTSFHPEIDHKLVINFTSKKL